MDSTIKGIQEALETIGEKQIADLLNGAEHEVIESGSYGSRLHSVVSTLLIKSSPKNTMMLNKLPSEQKDKIMEAALLFYPIQDDSPEIREILFKAIVQGTTLKDLTAFEIANDELIAKGNELRAKQILSVTDLQILDEETRSWIKACQEMYRVNLPSEFSDYFIKGFRASTNSYYTDNDSQKLRQQTERTQQGLHHLTYALVENYKLISVSDVIINPDIIKRENRRGFTIAQRREFMLYKLNQIADEEYHDLAFILQANGVTITETEIVDSIEKLENLGLVQTQGITVYRTLAAITTDGREHFEKQATNTSAGNHSTKEDIDKIHSRIDEVIELLKQTNMGNEVIFEELEEMKEAAGKIDQKNWVQLLKGKIGEMLSDEAKVLTKTTAGEIFRSLTHDMGIQKWLE